MATDSIMGLFSTPEQYQQAQSQAALNRGVQLAQLDPFQRASAQLYQGGYLAGGAIGGALGGQDPQLQAVSAIRELSSKYDTNTSGGVAGLATELQQRGMQQQAFQLGQRALEMRKLEAEAQAKTAERLTPEQKNATAMADASGATRGTSEWTTKYNTELARLTTPNKAGALPNIAKLQEYRKQAEENGASPAQLAQIDAVIKAEGQGRGVKVEVNPSLSLVDKESNLRKDFTTETKPITTVITTADRIDKLLTGNTSLGEVIARKQFAKLAGDTNISNRDVADLANFGDLGQRLSGILSGFFEGKYSESQRQEALGLVKQLKAESSNQYTTVQKQYRDRATAENIPEKTSQFIAPDLPVPQKAALPPEGTRLRNKKTGKIEVVRGGKLVPSE